MFQTGIEASFVSRQRKSTEKYICLKQPKHLLCPYPKDEHLNPVNINGLCAVFFLANYIKFSVSLTFGGRIPDCSKYGTH